MEVEGRYFQLNKSTLKVEDRPRTDKAYMMEIATIQNFEDMQLLTKFGRAMSTLPFELNAKQNMNAQICECFEVSYLDRDHQFLKWRRDNHGFEAAEDTGVKMTALVVINNDKYGDKEYGEIRIRKSRNQPSEPETEVVKFNMRHNSLILLKSRVIDYEIVAKK